MKKTIVFAMLPVLSFALILNICGCGSSTGEVKNPETEGAGTDAGIDDFEYEVPSAPVDMSTGEDLPTGEGEEAPERKQISAEASEYFRDGVNAANAKEYTAAEEFFKKCLSIDKNAFRAAYNLGVLYERRGEWSKARNSYRIAISIQPDYELAIRSLALLLIRDGQLDEAYQEARDKAHRFPMNRVIMNTFGNVMIAQKRYEDSERVFKQVLRNHEKDVESMLGLARANHGLGRKELASSILEQIMEVDPDFAPAYNFSGIINVEKEKTRLAIDNFKKAIGLDPQYIEAKNNLAVEYQKVGNYEDALKQMEAVVKLAPQRAIFRLNLGDAYRGAKRYEDAKKELDLVLRLDPSLTEAYFNLGVLFMAANKLGGLDESQRLTKAQQNFEKYKKEMGPRLGKSELEEVQELMKNISLKIERIKRRIAMEEERKRQEAEREAAKKAAEARGETGEAAEEEEWEDDEEEWED